MKSIWQGTAKVPRGGELALVTVLAKLYQHEFECRKTNRWEVANKKKKLSTNRRWKFNFVKQDKSYNVALFSCDARRVDHFSRYSLVFCLSATNKYINALFRVKNKKSSTYIISILHFPSCLLSTCLFDGHCIIRKRERHQDYGSGRWTTVHRRARASNSSQIRHKTLAISLFYVLVLIFGQI